MSEWVINIIGEQSLEVTNGILTIYKERDWLEGQGVYSKIMDYTIPTLIDFWEEIKKKDPQLSIILYSDFSITRYESGFVFQLETGYKDIVSDSTAKAQDLLAFIDMLDEIIISESGEKGALTERKHLKTILAHLDLIPPQTEKRYEH